MSSAIQPELEAKLRERAEAEGLTVNAYLEQLIRDEDADIASTEALLEDAADSGDYVELTEAEWDRIERSALAAADARTKRRS